MLKKDFLNEIWTNFVRNFSIIARSIFSNLRTYVFCFLLPTFVVVIIFTLRVFVGSTKITPPLLMALLFIPCFFIMLIVNVTISEWKNSVFLKRIHSSGVSKVNFLISLWTILILLGLISTLLSIMGVIITASILKYYPGMTIFEQFQYIGVSGWFIFFLSIIFAHFTSIVIATIISGLIKSVAAAQSVTVLILFILALISDIFIEPQLTASYESLNKLSYISPYKYWVWTSMLTSCEKNYNAILTDYAKSYKSFAVNYHLSFWLGFIYVSFLTSIAFFSFRWSSKG